MEFNPTNPVIQLCMQAMALEAGPQPFQVKVQKINPKEKAAALYHSAWEASTHDFERFIAAFFIGRSKEKVADQLRWLQTSLDMAQKVNSVATGSALEIIYQKIAWCYAALGNAEAENKYNSLSEQVCATPISLRETGPFYHGTKADLQIGDLLTAGEKSNYATDLVMHHIYFTALIGGAGLAAALAKGEGPERVYRVEPTGHFENDPNVTNQKFPGNLTRSYRSKYPLKIVGEETSFERLTVAERQKWQQKLSESKGKIIN
ncbi:rRNA adenine methyltransferase [Arachidicoccus ginsenosidivorans]|uniref:rRNA adenine methyltransferase n=1 Tax=Arachidicoccus ginsenosidivorans TaxID=496057 RepID=A0A5B8VI13_9BACT|nr:NAD(+)--rifampin ADP-ribosyltransferase [Arachidicoccus ginsenosidivorans]QEC71130.1 rRNA adenine methyltransferase [Arachidicoccus ginsenosidivorans]